MTNMPKIEMEWQRFDALTADRLYELLRFRQNIFVVEQRSPYPDLDDLDQGASHLLLRVEGELSGYLRLVPRLGPPPFVTIGRVAVAANLRRRGFARMLVKEALRLHHERYSSSDLALSAQEHLMPFYHAFGFVTTSQPYEDYGVRHVDMKLPRDA